MRTRFEELMSDPCCASCDCDALSSEVEVYLDRKTCDAERCRRLDLQAPAALAGRVSTRSLNENSFQR